MKIKKISILLATCICSATLLTGCTAPDFAGLTDKLFGKTEEVTEAEPVKSSVEKSGKVVDPSVEKPEFVNSISGANQVAMGAVFKLDATAKETKGTLTYQWYSNNVNSNGGGTLIQGATDPVYAVDTSETGRKFFYCVVTNEENGKINKSTSDTHEIVVWDVGTWQADETGGVRYMLVSGTYPTKTWFCVGEDMYYLQESGYRATGLSQIGDFTYYFNEEGALQRNTTGPNGEQIDEEGRVVDQAAPAEEAPAEQPSQDQPAQEQPAEAPAEEAPAAESEEAPSEDNAEAPAEESQEGTE